MKNYSEVTNDIRIQVRPIYIEKESSPAEQRFVFAYFIRVENLSNETVQLMRRYWMIRDSAGEEYEVMGDGVIGKQPVLAPGEHYEYNSYCILKSFRGSMEGYYEFERADGLVIRSTIPTFELISFLLN